MSVRAVAAVVAAVVAVLASGCGQADRVLDARLEADRMLVLERTEARPGTVKLRNGEEMAASAVDLQPERTRWTTPGDGGDSAGVDVPTVSVRSIRLSEPRPPLWRHLVAGAALGVVAGVVLSRDFGDGGSDASLFLWGGLGMAGGGLGGLSGRAATYEVAGGQEPAPPPP